MQARGTGRSSFLTSTMALAMVAVAAGAVGAETLLDGAEFQANTYTTGDQAGQYYGAAARSVARSSNGSFVVVWHSYYQDGDGDGIHGQRYDAAGAADGTEFQINSFTTYSQRNPAVASDADGAFVVVWHSYYQDGSELSIHGQRFDAAGAADGTEFQINSFTTYSQQTPAVASAADGAFVVVWRSYDQDGSGGSIHGQRYDAAGAADGTEFQINSYTTNSQSSPAVASDGDGAFVVVWQSYYQDGYYDGIHGQRFDAGGAADGTEFQINSFPTYSQRSPAVASDADGAFVVVWQSFYQDGSDDSIQGQRFDAGGAPDGTEFQVNSYTTYYQQAPAVASDADGAFVVVWQSAYQDDSGFGIHGQRFDAAGAADGTEFQINSYTTDYQFSPAIASDGGGAFVVVWQSIEQDGDEAGMFGQRLCTDADTDGNCDGRCPLSPAAGCDVAAQGKLDVNEKNAGKEKTKFQWKKLTDATVQGDFGDPVTGTTAVFVCIYDDADALVEELIVDRAGDSCAGKDCWKAKGTKGYGYKDKDNASDGVAKIGFGAGDPGKGKADAQGKNNSAKGQTALPVGVVAKLTGNTTPTIQLITTDGFCTTATMNEVKKDEPTRYSAQLK